MEDVSLVIKIPEKLRNRFKRLCVKEGVSMKEKIESFMKSQLSPMGRPKKKAEKIDE